MTSMSEKQALTNFKNIVSHHLFNVECPSTILTEYTKPLLIPPGLDTIRSIGEPKVPSYNNINSLIQQSLRAGGGGSKIEDLENLWIEAVSEYYPQEEEESLSGDKEKIEESSDKKEPKIDALLKQKMY